jgi:hypothetical protein
MGEAEDKAEKLAAAKKKVCQPLSTAYLWLLLLNSKADHEGSTSN